MNTDLIGTLLPRVEEELRLAVHTDDALLTEMASHLIVAGGKRQRPLVSLAAGSCTPNADIDRLARDVVLGGVSVELVHLGSLYHDDVIDEAEIRRQADSVNARWGNLRAILAGDFLLARASEIAASLSTEIAGLLAATIAKLCEGEVGELRHAFDPDRTEAVYLASIGGKTASLFAAAGRIGALTSGAEPDAVDALGHFGWCYGMAFQIVDDILDLTSTEAQLGKPAGHDLVEGIYTLPVIRALQGECGSRLRPMLTSEISPETLRDARLLVLEGNGIDEATEVARTWLVNATNALEPFSGTPGATALVGLVGRLSALLDR